jgi:hypothetical protein
MLVPAVVGVILILVDNTNGDGDDEGPAIETDVCNNITFSSNLDASTI